MFKNTQIITAVEIGTSKTCVLMCESDREGKVTILGHGETSSENSVCKGEITNMDAAISLLNDALDEARDAAETEIDPGNIYIGITGNHIRSREGAGRVRILTDDQKITEEDVNEAVKYAMDIAVPAQSTILNSIDGAFIIDDARRVSNPVGHAGNKLEAFSHIITADKNSIQTFQTPLRELGFDSPNPVFSGLASATGTLTDDELSHGVLLIDMGAGTTDYMLFHNHGVIASGSICVGCEHLANDISVGLDINAGVSRRILKDQLYRQAIDSKKNNLEIEGALGARNVPVNSIEKIFEMRLSETFRIIKSELSKNSLDTQLGHGIIICGGAALLPEVNDVLYSVFEAPVRKGIPQELPGAVTSLQSPRYSMALGLLLHGELDMRIRESMNSRSLQEGLKKIDRTLVSSWKQFRTLLKDSIKF